MTRISDFNGNPISNNANANGFPKVDEKTYVISDIYFAAFLRACGCQLTGNERRGKKTFFFFEMTPDIEKLRIAYYNKSAEHKVVPLEYADFVKNLKSLCYMS